MKKITTLFCLFFFILDLQAQTPHPSCAEARDLCNKAPVTVTSLSLNGASDPEPWCFNGPIKQPYWFHFNPVSQGTIEFMIFSQNGNGTDFDFALYQGCPLDGGTELACNYAAPFLTTGLTPNPSNFGVNYNSGIAIQSVEVFPGVDYYLLVDNYLSNTYGFTIVFGGTCQFSTGDPITEFPVLDAHSCPLAPQFDCSCLDGFESGTELVPYGGSIPGFIPAEQNPHVYRFTACACVMDFNIAINGPCLSGNGIEAQVVQIQPGGDCLSQPVTTLEAGYQLSPCQLTAADLSPGQTYALVIDGIDGASCPYKITVDAITPPPLAYTDTIYAASSAYCEGDTMGFSIDPIQNALHCYWQVPPGWDTLNTSHGAIAAIAGHGNGLVQQVCVVASNGCGNVVTICRNITIYPDTTVNTSAWVCDSDLPYAFNGQNLTEPGTYRDTFPAFNGCDSIVVLHLIVTCCDQPTPNFGTNCAEATLLCESVLGNTLFNNFTDTPDVPGNLAAAFCYPVGRNRWLKLPVCDANVALGVTVENCTGSNPANDGLEFALFNTADCQNFTLAGDCAQVLLWATDTLLFDGLSAGDTYYLMVDGMADNQCSFRLEPIAGINSGEPDSFVTSGTAADGMINGDKEVCPGQIVTYTITPPSCEITMPIFNCPVPAGACSWCGTGFEIDSFTYLWHIPDCARFLGDSTGLDVTIVYDQCVFTTDTIIDDTLWVEIIPVYADTFFHAGDTLTFCPCFCVGFSCGSIPVCPIKIIFNVEDIFLEIPCAGPPPVFNNEAFPTPGTFNRYDVTACILYIIQVTKQLPPEVYIIPPFSTITCYQPEIDLTVVSDSAIAQCSWFGPNQNAGTSTTAYIPGIYSAIVTATNGCTAMASTNVDWNQITPAVSLGPDITICPEEMPYPIQSLINLPNYHYYWTGGSIGLTYMVSQAPNTTKTYTVTVTDAYNGCTSVDNIKVTVLNTKQVTVPVMPLCPGECFDDGTGNLYCPTPGNLMFQSVFTSWQGCDSMVTYLFTLMAPDTLDQGNAGTLSCNQTAVQYLNQTYTTPGIYYVKIDACTYHKITIDIDSASPQADAGPDQSGCFGDAFSLQSAGFNPAFNYSWSTGQTGQGITVQPVSPGAYTYTLLVVNPLNGCQIADDVTITVLQPIPPTVLPPVTLCPGECFNFIGQTVCPGAGDPPYLDVLSSWKGCDSLVQQIFFFTAPDTIDQGVVGQLDCQQTQVSYNGNNFTAPGTFVVQTGTCTFEKFEILQNTTAPSVDAGPDQQACPGQSVSLAVQNAVLNWNYHWSNGAAGGINTVSPPAGTTVFTVTVTDPQNGCTASDEVSLLAVQDTIDIGVAGILTCSNNPVVYNGGSYSLPGLYHAQLDSCTTVLFEVTVNLDAPSLDAGPDQNGCAGQSFNLSVPNPGAGWQYQWSDGSTAPAITVSPAQMLTTYTVTVTDPVNGCTASDEVSVTIAVQDTVDLGLLGVLTCANPTVGYSDIVYFQPGLYYDVLDSCTAVKFLITQNIMPPVADAGADQSGCLGQSFNVAVTNPVPGWQYQWSDGSTGPAISVSLTQPLATYQVTVTDPLNGCTATDAVTLHAQGPLPPTQLPALSLCPGDCFQFYGQTVCPAAGDPPAAVLLDSWLGCDSLVMQPFSFNTPDTLQTGYAGTLTCVVTQLEHNGQLYAAPGTYVQKIDNCTYEQFIIATDTFVPLVNLGDDVYLCQPQPLSLAPLNDHFGFIFDWGSGAAGPVLNTTPQHDTLYILTVTNPANGCAGADDVAVFITGVQSVDLGAAATITCSEPVVTVQGRQFDAPGAYTFSTDCTDTLLTVLIDTFAPHPLALWTQCEPLAAQYSVMMLLPPGADWRINGVPAPDSLFVSPLQYSGNSFAIAVENLDNGCAAGFEAAADCEGGLHLFIPNIILPAAGVPNGYFTLYAGDNQLRKITFLRIYDRWGDQVFGAEDIAPNIPELGWDGSVRGKPARPGVYVYKCEIELIDGRKEMKEGELTLMR